MKTGVNFVAILLLLAVVALAAEAAEDGAMQSLFSRKLKDDSYKNYKPKDYVDCKPKEKDCPYGYYCVYYPDKKCKTEKECKYEKEKKCKRYDYYYATSHSGYSSHGSHGYHGKRERKCAEYGYEDKHVCYDKQVCFEYICAKVVEGYH